MRFLGIPDRKKFPGYYQWIDMRARCNTPSATGYAHYGGRGVRVCSRWNSFEAFIEDMGPRPSPKHTIERLDEHADYGPSNCVWATRREQARNRPSYNRFDMNSARELRRQHAEGKSVRRLARETGIPYSTVRSVIKDETWREGA